MLRVLSDSGSPIVGALVSGDAIAYCDSEPQVNALPTATTNSSGWTTFLEGYPGDYILNVTYSGQQYALSVESHPEAATYVTYRIPSGSLTTAVCYYNENCSTTTGTTQSTNEATSLIDVQTQNSNGRQFFGYYITLWQDGVKLQGCFSACSFAVDDGQTYQVAASSYGNETFSHWQNDGSTGFETVSIPEAVTSTISLTAVYTLSPRDNASTVASGINTPPTRPSWERKVVVGAGLDWVFYSDGNDTVYSTSANGIAWSSPTTIIDNGYRAWWFSVYQNGSELYYTYATTGVYTTPYIYYGDGTLEGNGTIAWQVQSASIPTVGTYPDFPSITLDRAGNIWLSAETYGADGMRHIEVYKVTAGGTWQEVFDKGGFEAYPAPILSALDGQGMALEILSQTGQLTVYTTGDGGATWSGGVSAPSQYQDYSAVSVGDAVYIAGVDLAGDVEALSYTYGAASFSPETTLAGAAYAYNGVTIATDGVSSLAVLYSNSSTILMQDSTTTLGSSWGAPTTVAFNENDIAPASITMDPLVGPNVVAIWSAYSPGSTMNYDARFIAFPSGST